MNKSIDEDMVRSFIWGIGNYFARTSKIEAEVEAPYLMTDLNHSDFTGVIGISGDQQGAVYVTVPKELLIDLYRNHYAVSLGVSLDDIGEEEFNELITDSAGEMANTVSGNVRNFLGENFLISTPIVFQRAGLPMEILEDSLGIVFPIRWQQHLCHIVVGLTNKLQS